MTATPGLRVEPEGSVLVLVLDRPASANAIDSAAHEAVVARLAEASSDAAVQALVLAAAGERIFSAGADLKEFADLPPGEGSTRRRALLLRTLLAILDFPKPLVCAVQGKALGGGWMLALAADEVIAAESAAFGLPEIGHGIPTPMGAALVAFRANRAVARELTQTGRSIGAAEAHRLGLIDEVVAPEALRERALARARLHATSAAAAYAGNKHWINRGVRAELEAAADAAGKLARANS